MTLSDSSLSQDSPQAETTDQQVALLLDKGLNAFDPVRFQYIVALLKRAEQHTESVAEQLRDKADLALEQYRLDCVCERHAQKEIQPPQKSGPRTSPLLDLIQKVESGQGSSGIPVDELSFDQVFLATQIQEKSEAEGRSNQVAGNEHPAMPRELKSVQRMRESWSKQNSIKLVLQALKEKPIDPGPLNPEMLITKALTEMQDLSPEYLNRYVSYLETLVWLEQADS